MKSSTLFSPTPERVPFSCFLEASVVIKSLGAEFYVANLGSSGAFSAVGDGSPCPLFFITKSFLMACSAVAFRHWTARMLLKIFMRYQQVIPVSFQYSLHHFTACFVFFAKRFKTVRLLFLLNSRELWNCEQLFNEIIAVELYCSETRWWSTNTLFQKLLAPVWNHLSQLVYLRWHATCHFQLPLFLHWFTFLTFCLSAVCF